MSNEAQPHGSMTVEDLAEVEAAGQDGVSLDEALGNQALDEGRRSAERPRVLGEVAASASGLPWVALRIVLDEPVIADGRSVGSVLVHVWRAWVRPRGSRSSRVGAWVLRSPFEGAAEEMVNGYARWSACTMIRVLSGLARSARETAAGCGAA
jgi:hypothetical protein